MVAATIEPSVFDKALPQLPAAVSRIPEAVQYVGEWLAVLAVDPTRGPEFDREIESYATDLRRAGLLTEHQGSGFLLALWAYSNVGSPLQATLVAQVDRRQARRGVVHCRWRGDVGRAEYESVRHDDALRRSQLPNKWEREGRR